MCVVNAQVGELGADAQYLERKLDTSEDSLLGSELTQLMTQVIIHVNSNTNNITIFKIFRKIILFLPTTTISIIPQVGCGKGRIYATLPLS